MTKKSKPNHSDAEKLAQAVEQCLPVLLSNVPVAMSDTATPAKLGYALTTLGIVVIRALIGSTAWMVRTKL